MQNIVRKPAVKITAFVLSIVTLVLSVLGIMGFVICMDESYYSYTVSSAADITTVSKRADLSVLRNIYRDEVPEAVMAYNRGTGSFQSQYSPDRTNLRISVQEVVDGKPGTETFTYDAAGETPVSQRNYYVVQQLDEYGNHSYFDTATDSSIFQRYSEYESGPEVDAAQGEDAGIQPVRRYIVKMGIAATPLVYDQITLITGIYDWLYQVRFALIWVTAGTVILGLVAHIVMAAGAGRRPGEDAV